ncbi:MBL fold metallo-hydrolase [Cronobacter sakazakii]|uniref:MBL fold metallo-hydrolase n=1 Tax=Cronobacter sakazakii TaxID=28141 RepID=UPI0015590FAF|nr:MBL fold metallo-hydrolase [Cronobacter sakazakii]EKK5221181.1 MBL fold metallo-hydrolase [Cronobacter sakazakii]ELY3730069.1 MBL fold metallo-hydrolase [Cronobacter sakazakii]ELY3793335.1 MBL fold metallo-hydrolase [Cronobacter sakazakii]ELY3828626.1 MBL fold metallo-hydrolase [Cronobacter sakazakii]ELY4141789.1 MBL fold metallo-hydrolase [Cronobacter sakazakii]
MMKTAATLLALFTFALAAPLGAAPLPVNSAQAPGYYRMMLGDWQITAVSDGTVTIPADKLLTRITPDALKTRLADDALTPQVETSINAYVINTGDKLILVDSGAGALLGNNGGHLPENLRAAGIDPSQIDTVLLTHIHADHSGGVQRDGKPVFPNAIVRVDQRDLDFWLNPAHEKEVEASQLHTFAESEQSLRPVISAGKMKAFHAPAQIMPDIEALPAPGHTPGSVIYKVTRGGETLLLWGDIIHVKAVQMPQPQVAIHFDVNQDEAVAMREKTLKMAAQSNAWVASAHIAFPGIGKIKAQGDGYRWVPVNYSSHGAK